VPTDADCQLTNSRYIEPSFTFLSLTRHDMSFPYGVHRPLYGLINDKLYVTGVWLLSLPLIARNYHAHDECNAFSRRIAPENSRNYDPGAVTII